MFTKCLLAPWVSQREKRTSIKANEWRRMTASIQKMIRALTRSRGDWKIGKLISPWVNCGGAEKFQVRNMINGWASACFQLASACAYDVLICEPGEGKWRNVTWFECARHYAACYVFSAIKAREISRVIVICMGANGSRRVQIVGRNYLFQIFCLKHERHQFVEMFCNIIMEIFCAT